MSGINKVILVARLGKDPEGINQGTKFTAATSESWVKDGKKEEVTTWHNIVAFGKLGEICSKYLKKGSQVYIEGRLQTRAYEKDGEKRYSTSILAEKVEFLGSKAESKPEIKQSSFFQDEKPDDLPF